MVKDPMNMTGMMIWEKNTVLAFNMSMESIESHYWFIMTVSCAVSSPDALLVLLLQTSNNILSTEKAL